MKITFLGTSAGIPDPDRHCSSTMIEVGERVYIVDAGAPMVDCLRTQGLLMERENAERIAAVFATHSHSDHTVGMLHLLDACTWYFRTASFEVILPEKGLGEKFAECIEIMEKLPFPSDRLHLKEASAGVVYDDGVLRATYIPTRHCEPHPSYSILIEAEGKRMLYTGDLASDFHDYPSILLEEHFDAVLCELVHFNVSKNLDAIAKTKTKIIIFTHLSPYNIPRLRAAEDRLPFPVDIAEDGNCYEI